MDYSELMEKNKNNGDMVYNVRSKLTIMASESSLSEHLRTYISKAVIIKLRGGRSVRGRLLDFDQYMNLVIQDAVEHSDSEGNGPVGNNRLGTVLLRADNILIIAIESSI